MLLEDILMWLFKSGVYVGVTTVLAIVVPFIFVGLADIIEIELRKYRKGD